MTPLWMFFAIDALTGIKLQGWVEAETERQARERIQLAMKRIVVGTTDVGYGAVAADSIARIGYQAFPDDIVTRAPHHLQDQ
jgi:hypothetical protein